jgi:oligopeptidase B
MAPLAGLREELYQEMLSHVKQTDVSVPYRDGDWWYYTRTEEGLQYAIHCRKRERAGGAEAAGEEVLLDGNQLAEGHAFFAIGDTDITDDGRWLAYTTDTKGFRQYTLHIKDLETGETLAGEVERVAPWSGPRTIARSFTPLKTSSRSGSSSFGGTRAGHAARRRRAGLSGRRRALQPGRGRTRDGKYIGGVGQPHDERVPGAACGRADRDFTLIARAKDEHEYSVDHRNGLWFIRTNDRGRNFRLVTAPVATPGREHWTERIPHRDA